MHTDLQNLTFQSILFFWLPESIAEEIQIPSVFTSYYASQTLRKLIIPVEG